MSGFCFFWHQFYPILSNFTQVVYPILMMGYVEATTLDVGFGSIAVNYSNYSVVQGFDTSSFWPSISVLDSFSRKHDYSQSIGPLS